MSSSAVEIVVAAVVGLMLALIAYSRQRLALVWVGRFVPVCFGFERVL